MSSRCAACNRTSHSSAVAKASASAPWRAYTVIPKCASQSSRWLQCGAASGNSSGATTAASNQGAPASGPRRVRTSRCNTAWSNAAWKATRGAPCANSTSKLGENTMLWIIEKAREFQENIYFCFIDYAKAFDCVDHNKLWKILKEMGIPDHLICLLRNLYAGQEATVRTGHGTTNWFQIGKGVRQGCILSPFLFNLYAEYIMRNAGLEEAQAGIKIDRRNINNLNKQMTPPLWQKAMRN